MATISKLSLIFRFTSQFTGAGALLAPRLGGFSESVWTPAAVSPAVASGLGGIRARCLCPDVAVVGWRQTPYTYTGNKLLPGKASVGSFYAPGKFPGETNSPDDTLRLRAVAGGGNVTFTIFLHAVPDEVIESNAYIQNNNFQQFLAGYINALLGVSNTFPQIQWLGRDYTQPSQRVVLVNSPANTITLAQACGAVQNDYIRVRRVYDDSGNPIKGSFFVNGAPVTLPNTTVQYPVLGLGAQVRSTPSGTARKDLILSNAVTAITPVLLASRKIGRPTLLFHGRRTKQRV